MTLAEQLIRVLRQAGVERIYGVVGDSLNPIVDAIRRTDGIEWMVGQAAQMPRVARSAVQQAVGRGGVSVLVMPGDVLDEPAAHSTGRNAPVTDEATAVPARNAVHALADRLNAARTVTLFCGAGVRGFHAEVTDPNALSIPPHITATQVKGFALAAGKIVLGGGVGRMLELARSNVRNIPRPAKAR
jgi:thiamine pyrophosphate-dependent acetolactate synthase large subunit-like protein